MSNGVGEHVGVLVVMNDVTKLRRLENVRQDFVANVSHELRTPITAIRGYVETLLDGALDIRKDAVKFLNIVLHHSERLSAIIDDLLSLSRIEVETEERDIVREQGQLLPVLEAAIDSCRLDADKKNIRINVDCSESLRLPMNTTLLEQAVINLLVNSIKYSENDTEIDVSAAEVEGGKGRLVEIAVEDMGCGIARDHLPRLFERFYRSDQARSRELGGTGLGLAIVKHITQAHDGTVKVESVVGEGSTFTLILSGEES